MIRYPRESDVGGLVQRERRGYSHRLDAVNAGYAVTACGKRMAPRQYETGGLVLADEPDANATPGCVVCARITMRRAKA